MEILVNPEELIMCPYNKSHHIQRKRMAFHLVKCKKNYPESRIVNCDFNVTHKVPEVELQYHHENCPSRRNIELAVYEEAGSNTNRFPIQNLNIEPDESWDDCNNTTYDAKANCENRNVLRKLDVASAGSRRNFRISERRRINENFSSTESRSENAPRTESHPQRSDSSNKETFSNVSRSKRDERSKRPVVLPDIQQEQAAAEQSVEDSNVVSDLMAKIKLGAGKTFIQKVAERK
ncbi:gametocyte-specific factor 1 homolog [Leptinotarsa decemlineata]|uniref:gametocyte-specific factor 1 homolog n=1 Tax=Leptinotarsa decemlineata TaxID=7539 RepID=UPI000C2543BA|nr:gametocyte-specific factor 1 homolog [Leptinotarsa decemlineata]